MRAAVLTSYDEPFTVEDLEPRPLGAREARVRIDACGVCHSDLTIARGGMPIPLPAILGHEGAGTVIEVGAGVQRVAPGDRVIVAGNHCGTCAACVAGQVRQCHAAAESAMVPKGRRSDGSDVIGLGGMGLYVDELPMHETQLLRVESSLPATQLALIGCAVATGAGAALFTAQVRPASTVAVIGLGGVGISAVQGARICGASRIFVIDPVAAKREQAAALGATDLVDPADGDPVQQVRDATSGAGVDYAFEVVGRPELMVQAYKLARRNGTVVIVGMARATDTLTLPALPLMTEGKRLLGSFMGGTDIARDYPKLIRLAESGLLDVGALVTRTIALDEINDAMRAMEAGEVVRSVIV
ncbi:MAG TPA: Zn-dependent alcohol dehydrogenase [Acidimicrobiales bacterium]|nr:Zn-dependent alcohol dehydrogenase [Acidimicrobiales bacterium]